MRSARSPWLVAVACGLALAAAPASASPAPAAASSPHLKVGNVICKHAQERPRPATLPEARRATLCLINIARIRAGLPLIHTNAELRIVARRYAMNMMHHNFYSHVTPAGLTIGDRARARDYFKGTGGRVAEALVWGQAEYSTPLGAVLAWLKSPPHRRLLMSRRYNEMGIGVAFGSPRAITGATYEAGTYAAIFGFRKEPKPKPPGK